MQIEDNEYKKLRASSDRMHLIQQYIDNGGLEKDAKKIIDIINGSEDNNITQLKEELRGLERELRSTKQTLTNIQTTINEETAAPIERRITDKILLLSMNEPISSTYLMNILRSIKECEITVSLTSKQDAALYKIERETFEDASLRSANLLGELEERRRVTSKKCEELVEEIRVLKQEISKKYKKFYGVEEKTGDVKLDSCPAHGPSHCTEDLPCSYNSRQKQS
jgi:hypothetical protein